MPHPMTPPPHARTVQIPSRLLAAAVAFLVLGASAAHAQFQIGLQDPDFTHASSDAQAAEKAIAPSLIRVTVYWAGVAPNSPTLPAGFNPADPADSHYHWAAIDAEIRAAAQRHLQVLMTFLDAPGWAQGPGHPNPYASPGAWNPKPQAFAQFVHAAAIRYGGSFVPPRGGGGALPRVRYWEAWNEPNIPGYFAAPDPVAAYRTLLDRAYTAIKAVHADNLVEAGGLAPISSVPGSIPPLQFAADLLCVGPTAPAYVPVSLCTRSEFDALGIHPYSFGATPTKHASTSGDVFVGDLGELGSLVAAGDRLRGSTTPIWATEFTWPTNPPNKQFGDPSALAARYVAYSAYEMWSSGADMLVWATPLRDALNANPSGGGLYTLAGRPKLTLRALAFPFVAGAGPGGPFAWGRAPTSRPAQIVVERAHGSRWQQVAAATTGADGVFKVAIDGGPNGTYRARVIGGPTSLAYDSSAIPPVQTHPYTFG
jgi:hypothetical protein